MDLDGAVIDAEGAHFAQHLLHHCVARDACGVHDLDAAVGDAHQRFAHRYLFAAPLERLAVINDEIRACDIAARVGQQIEQRRIE